MIILDGKQASKVLKDTLKVQIQDFTKKEKILPCLAVILAGENPASHIYVKHKILACKEVGIDSKVIKLPDSLSLEELKQTIQTLNKDPSIHGVLVQLPLPKQLSTEEVFSILSPKKDVDCLTAENIGLFWSSTPRVQPCTPMGIILLLKHYNLTIQGKNAVVIGRSHIVGRPMAQLLLENQATVTLCHSKTKDLKYFTKQADLVIVACGKLHLLNYEYFKKETIVVDVGIHKLNLDNSKSVLKGDVNPEKCDSILKALTPVPGGVGPMTIASLLINTFKLVKKQIPSSNL